MSDDIHEVFAVRYASHARKRSAGSPVRALSSRVDSWFNVDVMIRRARLIGPHARDGSQARARRPSATDRPGTRSAQRGQKYLSSTGWPQSAWTSETCR